jgi:hypothetical protein
MLSALTTALDVSAHTPVHVYRVEKLRNAPVQRPQYAARKRLLGMPDWHCTAGNQQW